MKKKSAESMKSLQVLNPCAAGIDIGSVKHFVCRGPSVEDVKSFATDTRSLHELVQWLRDGGIKTVAMESTGVYWIPLFELLADSEIEVLLVDARSLKRVPGRKTDVLDCQWLQKLHTHGLLNGCFRPGEEIVRLRSLVRMKTVLTAQQSDWIRRMQKELEQMNIRVHRAVEDITGKTGIAYCPRHRRRGARSGRTGGSPGQTLPEKPGAHTARADRDMARGTPDEPCRGPEHV